MILQLKMEHPSLARADILDVVRLIRSENVGPVTFFSLVSYFGSVQEALKGAPELAKRGGRQKPIKIADRAEAEAEVEKAHAFGATFISYGSDAYPKLLHMIHDAPPLLMALGNPSVWQKGVNIGVVGARNASANGCRFAAKMAQDLGREGIAVVSGLARGVDAAAHQGALSTGTVGVIAGGIDNIYPPENRELFARLREQGAIISEQPFGSAPQARNFPARNRIISGMSHGVVVVEASLKSGSLTTARMSVEQNRDVFAVPGSPLDPRCNGTNKLIRDGAVLTESAQDVLRHIHSRSMPLFEPSPPDYDSPSSPACRTIVESELVEARRFVIEKLSPTPVLVDDLMIQCQLTSSVLMTVLLELELAGRLQRHAGSRVSLNVEMVSS